MLQTLHTFDEAHRKTPIAIYRLLLNNHQAVQVIVSRNNLQCAWY